MGDLMGRALAIEASIPADGLICICSPQINVSTTKRQPAVDAIVMMDGIVGQAFIWLDGLRGCQRCWELYAAFL